LGLFGCLESDFDCIEWMTHCYQSVHAPQYSWMGGPGLQTTQLCDTGEDTCHKTLVVLLTRLLGRLALSQALIAMLLDVRVCEGAVHRRGHGSRGKGDGFEGRGEFGEGVDMRVSEEDEAERSAQLGTETKQSVDGQEVNSNMRKMEITY
jgi:hypothetical protein